MHVSAACACKAGWDLVGEEELAKKQMRGGREECCLLTVAAGVVPSEGDPVLVLPFSAVSVRIRVCTTCQ